MIHLTDFCEDGSDDVASIVDARAEWAVGVAVAVLELGLACMAGTGRRAVKQRPSVAQCIDTVKQLMQLPMLPLPPATQKECVVCLDAPRGQHRFMPCKHSVCCGTCAAMFEESQMPCAICGQPVQRVQEGVFMDTFSA